MDDDGNGRRKTAFIGAAVGLLAGAAFGVFIASMIASFPSAVIVALWGTACGTLGGASGGFHAGRPVEDGCSILIFLMLFSIFEPMRGRAMHSVIAWLGILGPLLVVTLFGLLFGFAAGRFAGSLARND